MDRRRPWLLDTLLVLFVFLISLHDLREGGGGKGPSARLGPDDFPEAAVPLRRGAHRAAVVPPQGPGGRVLQSSPRSCCQWTINLWQPAGICVLIALYTPGPARAAAARWGGPSRWRSSR